MYKPKEYWTARGKTYYQDFRYNQNYVEQEKHLVDFMKKYIVPDTILEVGCGFGRISNLLINSLPIKKYDAIDISPDQIIKARSICDTRINFLNMDINSFYEYNKHYYDLVLSIEVLMHIHPNEIEKTIKMLLKKGKRLLHIDYYQDVSDIELKEHNFNHDYFRIYKSLDIPVISMKIGLQTLFYV